MQKKKVGLALGGGAARGLAHIGLLKFFGEKNIHFDVICGNSMGAFVGALYLLCQDINVLEEELTRYLKNPLYRKLKFGYLLQSHKEGSLFYQLKNLVKKGVVTFSLFRKCLVTGDIYERVIDYFFKDWNFSDLSLPFACSALDLIRGEEVIFTKGPLKPAIMATCALPGILPPVAMEGYLLVDGGFINRVPIRLARLLGADIVIGIDVAGDLHPPKSLNTGMEIVLRANAMVRHYLNELQLQEADLVLRPNVGNIHWADFDRLKELIAIGRKCAEEHWAQIENLLNKFNHS